jgi:hypothetical protein
MFRLPPLTICFVLTSVFPGTTAPATSATFALFIESLTSGPRGLYSPYNESSLNCVRTHLTSVKATEMQTGRAVMAKELLVEIISKGVMF